MKQWTAKGETVLLANVGGLHVGRDERSTRSLLEVDSGKRVEGGECGVAIEIVTLSMELIAAALGHGVDYATSRPAILGRVVRKIDLELLDRRFGRRVPDGGATPLFGEKGLVVVRA